VATPSAPTSLTATAISGSEVSLSWNYSLGTNATQFAVERSTGRAGFSQVALVSQATSYIDAAASPSTTYTYQVQAVNYAGASGTSNTVTATTPEFAPGIPLNALALWLKADSGVNLDGSGNAYGWIDQSGNNNNATQTTGSSQPQLITTGTSSSLNERPALQFNNDYLSIHDLVITGTSQFTWVYVAEWTGTSTPDGTQFLMSQGIDSEGAGFYVGGFNSAPADELMTTWTSSNGLVEGSAVTVGQPVLGVSVYNGESHQLYVNGVFQGSAPISNSAFTGGTTTAIGCLYDSASSTFLDYAQADITEIMVFNRALNNDEIRALDQYLASKYMLPSFDVDNDGLTIGQDIEDGINPLNPDQNGDGLLNGVTVELGISPTDYTLLGNGYTNAENLAMGIDLFSAYEPFSPPPDSDPTVAPTITLLSPPDAVPLP
jgi:hypothetical protein